MFIHPFSKGPGGFSYIMFVVLSTGYQVYDIIKFTCDLFCFKRRQVSSANSSINKSPEVASQTQ